MDKNSPVETKPNSRIIRPAITRLPVLTKKRKVMRIILHYLVRLLTRIFIKLSINGLENFPAQGPVLVVANHLGDADAVIGVACAPRMPELFAKSELYDLPILGKLMEAFGVIWVHRGQADRRTIRAALSGLADGRVISLAPEGRESLTGGLEEGTRGAAYLALKSKAPILPVTFTGTENARVYSNMKRLRRTPVTITIGAPFYLPETIEKKAVDAGTQFIMRSLAQQLPPEYRGIYRLEMENNHGS